MVIHTTKPLYWKINSQKIFKLYIFQVKIPKTTLVYFSIPFDAVIGVRLAILKKVGR